MVSFTYFVSTQIGKRNISKDEESNHRHHRKYFEGVVENLKRIITLYPSNWNMRLYIDGRRSSGMTESICKNVCALEKGMKPNKKSLCATKRSNSNP